MKKGFTIIIAVLALVINFLCFWYSDFLINRYFVFGLIPICFSIIAIIVSAILSIVFIAKNKKQPSAYVSLAISIITVILIFVFPFRTARVDVELTLLEKDRLEIIQMVRDGEITVDDIGNASLPKEYDHLSSDGEIFVYQNDSEQVISFWVFRGILSGSVQLVYSSTDESLIYANETGHPITNIKKLKDRWYLVDTDY